MKTGLQDHSEAVVTNQPLESSVVKLSLRELSHQKLPNICKIETETGCQTIRAKLITIR